MPSPSSIMAVNSPPPAPSQPCTSSEASTTKATKIKMRQTDTENNNLHHRPNNNGYLRLSNDSNTSIKSFEATMAKTSFANSAVTASSGIVRKSIRTNGN